MRKITNSAVYAPFSCYDSGDGFSVYLNSQNNHPPRNTPNFTAFSTYKFRYNRHFIPIISMINSTSCQLILSSTSPWYLRSFFYAIGFFHTASNFFTNLLVLCPKSAPCSEAAAQATTAAAAANQAADHCKAFPKPLRAGFWLTAILTRSERGPNEIRNEILGN